MLEESRLIFIERADLDGAAGATAIKRLGGALIASSIATSEQAAMPEAAIDTGQVDHVLALDDIGAALTELASE